MQTKKLRTESITFTTLNENPVSLSGAFCVFVINKKGSAVINIVEPSITLEPGQKCKIGDSPDFALPDEIEITGNDPSHSNYTIIKCFADPII